MDEKQITHDDNHVEKLSTGAVSDSSDIDVDEVYSYAEQRSIIHRIDRRLVSMCGIIYCISLMDRTNLSAAAIAGMTVELDMMRDFRYNIVALVFFVTYTLFQPPATVLTRKIGPRIFLPTITVMWGAVMIGFGFAKDWGTLAGLRVILGLFEAGFFPGAVYLLSTWYSRFDMQKRYTVFYLIGMVASALSGILAYGLMQMGGLANLGGWRWIFIMEGIISVLIGIAGYIFIVNFPENAANHWGFLNQAECDFIIRRVNKDRGDVTAESFTLGRFLRPALDFKVWVFALLFCCATTQSYAVAYFLPIILRNSMGFSIAAAQCLVAPPFAFAGIIMFTEAYFADKFRLRGPIIVINALIGIIGLPILGYAGSSGVRYFGVFLVTAACNANVPAILAYQANNIRGQWKRAFCSASLVGFGGIGGIAGSLIFRDVDAPRYIPGIWACMTANFIIIISVGLLSLYFTFANKRAREGRKLVENYEGFYYTL